MPKGSLFARVVVVLWATGGLGAPAALAAKNQAPIPPHTSSFDLNFPEGSVSWICIEEFVDPEGQPLSYTFEKVPPGLQSVVYPEYICLEGRLGYDLVTPGRPKRFKWKVTAHDVGGRRKSVTLALLVSDVNPAPEVGPTAAPQVLAVAGTPFEVTFASSVMIDLQGEPLTYLAYDLPAWLALDAGARRLSGTPAESQVGSGEFRLCAQDAVGQIRCRKVAWQVDPSNRPPDADSLPAVINAVEDVYSDYFYLDSHFSDPEGDDFELTVSGQPSWFREVSWAPGHWEGYPTTDAEAGDWTLTITATDVRGASAQFTVLLRATARNDSPKARSLSDPIAAVGEAFTLTLPADHFADEESGVVPAQLDNAPDWLTYDPVTRTLSGVPARTDLGVHPVGFRADDPQGATGRGTLFVRVPDQNGAPVAVAPPGPQEAERDASFALDASGVFEDPEGDDLSYSVEGLPTWLAFDPTTASFTGTPTELTVRPHTVRFGAFDAAGESEWVEFTVAVVAAGAAEGATVTGVIRAQADAAMDWDVNDPDAPYRSNRYQGDAQRLIGTQAVVGGFLAAAATGEPGQTFAEVPDLYDVFRVTLRAGQTVTLVGVEGGVYTWSWNDIDLYLFDPNFGLADASLAHGAVESVVAPTDGEYLIVLDAVYGAGNYLLTVDAPPAAGAALAKPRLAAFELVTGEALVRLAPAPVGAAAKPFDAGQRAAQLGVAKLDGDARRTLRATLDLAQERRAAMTFRNGARDVWRERALADPRQGDSVATQLAAKRLAQQPGVARASVNGVMRPLALPDDPLWPRQWDMRAIDLPAAWDITTGDADVIVAVLDTGVLPGHPDLAPNLVAGYDFISDPSNAADGDGRDADPSDPGDDLALGWSSFHGTHVAGTVGARGDDGVGIAGTAWSVKLMTVRVLGRRGGTWLDVAEAIRYAAGLPNAAGVLPARRADVINMSLGGTGYSLEVEEAIAAARAAGVVVVASAGNSSDSTRNNPAAYDGVLSVAATDRRDERAYYSTHNQWVDLAAPGGDARFDRDGDGFGDGVLSCLVDDRSGVLLPVYDYYQGTSMAAPHVAGVVALMRSVNPALTPLEIESDLAAGLLTRDSGGDGATVRNDAYGYGLIDAPKAVLRALARAERTLAVPLALAEPGALQFGFADATRLLAVRNAGDGAATLGAPVADQPWLATAPFSVAGDGFGSWTVSVDRSGLAEGDHVAQLSFARDGLGPLVVPVLVRVTGPSNPAPDNGRHYVVFADPITLATVAAAPVEAEAGEYRFSVRGVPAGEWLLFVGSDRDGDGAICDEGEACGAAPSLEAMGTVVVGGTDLDVGVIDTAFRGEAATFGVAPALLKLAPTGVAKSPNR